MGRYLLAPENVQVFWNVIRSNDARISQGEYPFRIYSEVYGDFKNWCLIPGLYEGRAIAVMESAHLPEDVVQVGTVLLTHVK